MLKGLPEHLHIPLQSHEHVSMITSVRPPLFHLEVVALESCIALINVC